MSARQRLPPSLASLPSLCSSSSSFPGGLGAPFTSVGKPAVFILICNQIIGPWARWHSSRLLVSPPFASPRQHRRPCPSAILVQIVWRWLPRVGWSQSVLRTSHGQHSHVNEALAGPSLQAAAVPEMFRSTVCLRSPFQNMCSPSGTVQNWAVRRRGVAEITRRLLPRSGQTESSEAPARPSQ